jgi:hypothetical protein
LLARYGPCSALSWVYPSGYCRQPFFNFGDAIVLFTAVALALFNVYAGKMLRTGLLWSWSIEYASAGRISRCS